MIVLLLKLIYINEKNTKSPLTDKPLRNRGSSLDEQINKIYENDITTYLMWATFAVITQCY